MLLWQQEEDPASMLLLLLLLLQLGSPQSLVLGWEWHQRALLQRKRWGCRGWKC